MSLRRCLAILRRWRGFDLIQLAVVTFLIALLAAVTYAAMIQLADDTRQGFLEQLLISVDAEARSLARQAGQAGSITAWRCEIAGRTRC